MKIACFAQNIYNFLLDLSINPAAPFVSRTKARPSEKLRACYVRNLQDQKNSFKTNVKIKPKTSSGQVQAEPSCGNVYKDLGFSDAESANLIARSDLLMALQDIIEKNGWTQIEAAKKLKVGQPRVAEILGSQSSLFSVDLLIKYLARLGVQVNFKFSKLDWK